MELTIKKTFVVLTTLCTLAVVPQESYGQGWLKKIGQGLDAANKILGGGSNSTNSQTGNRNSGQGNSTSDANAGYGDKNKARYQIHITAQTKTFTVDGGVSSLGIFSSGRAIIYSKTIGGFTIDNSKGVFVIDREGNKVFDIPAGYTPKGSRQSFIGDDSDIRYDSNRLMVYSGGKKSAIVYDENGNVVKEFNNVEYASGFNDGVALIMRSEKKQGSRTATDVWYHIDVNGNVLSKTLPSNGYSSGMTYRVFPLREGLAPVYQEKVGWGYRNAQCQWVINPTFGGFGADDGGGFYNGLSRAESKENQKWGYINKQGQWIIQPAYTNRPGNFYAKYALVTDKAGNKYFIDQTGKFVWEQPAERIAIREFMSTGYAIWTYQSGSYIIDTSFNKVTKLDIDAGGAGSRVVSYNENYFQWFAILTETSKVYDWNGYLLLQFKEGGVFSEGICSKDNYYFNDKGEIIVKFEDSKF